MRIFRSVSLRTKLILLTTSCSVLMLAVGAIAYKNTRMLEERMGNTHTNLMLTHAHGTADMFHDALRGDFNLALVTAMNGKVSAEARQKLLSQLAGHIRGFRENVNTARAHAPTPEIHTAFDKLPEPLNDYLNAVEEVTNLALSNRRYTAIKQQAMVEEKYTALEKPMEEVSGLIENWSAAIRAEAQASVKEAIITTIIVMVAVFFLNIVVGTIIGMRAARPIKLLAEAAAKIATGDFTATTVQHESKDEIGDLVKSFNAMKNDLQQTLEKEHAGKEQLALILGQVHSVSASVAAATEQLVSSIDNLSDAAQTQSQRVEETVQAVADINATIAHAAHNASRTAQYAQENGSIAANGEIVVQDTVRKMRRIGDVVGSSMLTIKDLGKASESIGQVVTVINEIANQTNLLALNAAIEAARAGEYGRGFAAVADEVRKLAERTSMATREITNTVQSIQQETQTAIKTMHEGNEEVQSGIDLADKAGASLNKIVNSAREVMSLAHQIATANEEISATSNEITQHVGGISTVAGESAHALAEISYSISELNRQTTAMQSLLIQYNAQTNPLPARAADKELISHVFSLPLRDLAKEGKIRTTLSQLQAQEG